MPVTEHQGKQAEGAQRDGGNLGGEEYQGESLAHAADAEDGHGGVEGLDGAGHARGGGGFG
jgi:hypothetical protein